jgi:translin
MRDLKRIARAVEKEMDKKDRAREHAIRTSREMIRESKKIIHGIHNGDNVSHLMRRSDEMVRELRKALHQHPDLLHSGFVLDGLQEHAEAFIFEAAAFGKKVPNHNDLGVPPEAYILGLGDVMGELRRLVLTELKKGDIEAAEKHLASMETTFEVLMGFNYPDSLVPVRRKQDVARGLIERTRGEVTMASRTISLERKLGGKGLGDAWKDARPMKPGDGKTED